VTLRPLEDRVTTPGYVRASATVVWRDFGETLVVRDMRSAATFHLTGSGASLWQLIDRHGNVQAVIDHLTAQYSTREVERDVLDFVASALDRGLLDAVGASSATEPDRVNRGALQLGRASLETSDDIAALKTDFERQHYACLPHFIEPPLLRAIAERAEAERFVPRTHDGIGTELYLAQSPLASAMQLMFNDLRLLNVMDQITGCGPLRCFDGRVYRMLAADGHYDSWHSDAGNDRRVALSVNLSPEPYEDGLLEIRHVSSPSADFVVPRMPFGGAVIFRISPNLRHRVTPVSGARPRTAYAGWFCSSPDFQNLYFSEAKER
jgi:hypothetical protein